MRSDSSGKNRIEVTVTIRRPVEQVFGFYRDFKNLPTFLGDVMAIEPIGPTTSRWTIKGPFGIQAHWTIKVTEELAEQPLQRGRRSHQCASHPHEVVPQTAILISQAHAQTGNCKGATSFLEPQLQVQPPAADLYRALASIYAKQGNVSRAEDYKQRAAKLTN
ncbi:MAG TPA: SRPBCC family protein [Edaphobacter sp.]|nr:SRPBCC family protein [Edaphobacter sp.]